MDSLLQSRLLHDNKNIKRLFQKYATALQTGDFSSFLLEIEGLQYFNKKSGLVEDMNRAEQKSLDIEQMEKEREIEEVKVEIEQLKEELGKAMERQIERREWDKIAREIIKLPSREKSQRNYDTTLIEIEVLKEQTLKLEEKIEFRKGQFTSLLGYVKELETAITGQEGGWEGGGGGETTNDTDRRRGDDDDVVAGPSFPPETAGEGEDGEVVNDDNSNNNK